MIHAMLEKKTANAKVHCHGYQKLFAYFAWEGVGVQK
jgi:hypothetical protein